MELTPSVWKERQFEDKYGKSSIEWNEKTLTEYKYVFGTLRRILKIFWLMNFPYIALFSWIHLAIIIESHNILTIHSLILFINIALLFSRKLANTGWSERLKVIEFNRITGTVKKFDDNGELEYEYPFTDFNAYVHYEPGRYNGKYRSSPHYSLELVNRYTSLITQHDTINLFSFCGGSDADYCDELWNTLVIFMDVTKPLPFSIALEECRDKDPTSREYGLTTQYKPCFLAMTDEEYKQCLKNIFAQQSMPLHKRKASKQSGPKVIGERKNKHSSKRRRK
jgi:hypothetical protein